MSYIEYLAILSFGFTLYFLIHSAMASLRLKNYVVLNYPHLLKFYRIVFNVTAILLLIPLLGYMQLYQSPQLWQWSGLWHWLADGLAVLAIIGFLWTLTEYDGKEFLGLSQLKSKCTSVNDLEAFHISTPHRFVRHPWYFFALVILWTRDINVTQCVSYSLMSLYFVFGSMLEEKKLLQYHGDKYSQYCRHVPRLFPLPWRYLTLTKAKKLLT